MRHARRKTGSALAEFGPALGLTFIGFFFPIVDFCALFSNYTSCVMLNNTQCREAAMLTKEQAQAQNGLIRKQIPEYWANSGLGRFAAIKQLPTTQVTYSNEPLPIVNVQTTCTVLPWLNIPLPVSVPGMNAPTTFRIDGCAPVESATDRQ